MVSKSVLSSQLFELFDAKGGNTVGSNSKELRNMYKIWNPQLCSKFFDKQSKSHIIQLEASNKLIFPKDEKQELSINLEYLVIQCYIEPGNHLLLELELKDSSKIKRRVIFTNTVSKLEKKPFFVRMPSQEFKREVWLNLCFDLQSFMNLFQKCPAYQCLEGLTIGGNIKVRKIYLSKNILEQGQGFDQSVDYLQENLPKAYCFPAGIKYCTELINYERLEQAEEGKQIKNVSLPKISNHRQKSTPKTVVIPPKRNQSTEQKKFMSNTNSTEIINRLRNQRIQNQSKNRTTIKNKKNQVPPLPTKRPSINVWKMSKGKHESEDERVTKSQKITQLKKKNYGLPKQSQSKKAELSNYSDSDYLEMSQKFSTVTNPRLFRNFRQKQEEPEIEEFIEVEESVHQQMRQTKNPITHMKTVVQQAQNNEESFNQSQQGFLQQHLKNYIGQLQRPYTPPISTTEQKQESAQDAKPSQKMVKKAKQLELIYDGVLDYYYHLPTNTYYQLKP